MIYKLIYRYGTNKRSYTKEFNSKSTMESYIETGKDKDLRVVDIESSKMYGYARVSSKEQSLERQIKALEEYGVNLRDIITDKQSGKDFNRDGYKTLKEQLLREGDILVIKELDRLGRHMEQIKEEWEELQKKGINIVVIDTPIINTEGKSNLEKTLISNIVFELLSYMAEKERNKIKQRQAEGIANAKAKGKHLGRPKAEYPGNFKEVYKKWKAKDITGVKAMELMELKKNTFYNLVKRYESSF
ncbi:recombinase family protein [Clostridium perfringens]|nr:recombinase family protein [Clostridium perfringens]